MKYSFERVNYLLRSVIRCLSSTFIMIEKNCKDEDIRALCEKRIKCTAVIISYKEEVSC